MLLRQYANMGGTILEFNVDPHFSNALDGFLLVDLLKSDRRLLSRYMGREALAEFQGAPPRPGCFGANLDSCAIRNDVVTYFARVKWP